jgi:transcriptional regulator with XRE-family HTH domain
MAESFGEQLRNCRHAAGMSLGELARRINYSKSYLSKIENDQKPPNLTMAKLCDSALNAGGALVALVQPPSASVPEDDTPDSEVWVMSLDKSGDLSFQVDRRKLLAGGAGAMLGVMVTRGNRPSVDDSVLVDLRASFDSCRRLGQQTSPIVVLGQVIPLVHTLGMLAADSVEPVRSALMRLASRVAEYAGWMNQEAGSQRGALWWTRRAVQLAEAGNDRHLADYALMREAELALYRQDAISTVDLAQRAQLGNGAGPRILGLAARCEAQGHAMAGDQDAFERALDRAATLLSMGDPNGTNNPVLGSSTVTNEVSLSRGWALCDLGRPAESAELLDREVARIPLTARRARARFGARQALAHARNGEVEHACELTASVLYEANQVDSATVRIDLRDLAKTLARWRNHAGVREIYPELNRALNIPQAVG